MLRPVLVACLAACSQKPIVDAGLPSLPTQAAPAAAKHVNPLAKPPASAPHGSTISIVAVSDEGDAAISADDLGDVRLWPSLDGKQPPIPVKGIRPVRLAIGHAGEELVVATIDAAGNASIVRLTGDGVPVERTQLPGDVRVDEIAVVAGKVLVRRADQTIDVFEGATSRGRLVAPAGEQLGALVVRRGVAMALAGGDNGLRELRTIELAPVKWGKTVSIPTPAVHAALSPGHARLAIESAMDHGILVYELATMKQIGSLPPAGDSAQHEADLGFIDDDHLAAVTGMLAWWKPGTSSSDPWAQPGGSQQGVARSNETSDPAIGDGVLVSGSNLVLELSSVSKTHWLGYKDLPDQRVGVAGAHLTTTPSGMRSLWLDDDLRQTDVFDLNERMAELTSGTNGMMPVGDKKIVIERIVDGPTNKLGFEYADIDHLKDRVQLGAFANLERFDFQDDTLLVFADGKVQRIRIDGGKATELAPLVLASSGTFQLTDPAKANGVIAVSLYADDTGYHVATYREGKDNKTAIKPATGPAVAGYVFAFDTAGRRYVFTGTEQSFEVQDVDGKTIARHAIKGVSGVAAVSHDGKMVAFIGDHEVIGVDTASGERWRTPMWQPGTLMFTPDDHRLAIGTIAGFVVVDAATGQRTAMACGWGFGLWDSEPLARNFGQAPVCAE